MRVSRVHDPEQLACHRARPRWLGLEPRSFLWHCRCCVCQCPGCRRRVSIHELHYAIAPNWTAKVKYLFVDLANASCGFANCGGTNTTVLLNENVIRAGVNLKFGGGWC